MSENNQTKSNGRGGPRKGAGRKAGSASAKTRAIADQAASTGTTPLEVMLMTMNALVEQANVPAPADVSPVEASQARLKALIAASDVAKDAAPYMHPRLSAIEHGGKVTVRTLAEELAELNGLGDTEGDPSLA